MMRVVPPSYVCDVGLPKPKGASRVTILCSKQSGKIFVAGCGDAVAELDLKLKKVVSFSGDYFEPLKLLECVTTKTLTILQDSPSWGALCSFGASCSPFYGYGHELRTTQLASLHIEGVSSSAAVKDMALSPDGSMRYLALGKSEVWRLDAAHVRLGTIKVPGCPTGIVCDETFCYIVTANPCGLHRVGHEKLHCEQISINSLKERCPTGALILVQKTLFVGVHGVGLLRVSLEDVNDVGIISIPEISAGQQVALSSEGDLLSINRKGHLVVHQILSIEQRAQYTAEAMADIEKHTTVALKRVSEAIDDTVARLESAAGSYTESVNEQLQLSAEVQRILPEVEQAKLKVEEAQRVLRETERRVSEASAKEKRGARQVEAAKSKMEAMEAAVIAMKLRRDDLEEDSKSRQTAESERMVAPLIALSKKSEREVRSALKEAKGDQRKALALLLDS